MKHTRRIAAVLLALVMVLAMAAPVFAAETTETTYTITIDNSATGHTYSAYQIFKGDLSETTLSNVEWGNGVNGDALLAALKANDAFKTGEVNAFANCMTAADVTEVLEGKTDDSDFMKAFAQTAGDYLATVAGTSNEAEGKYTISGLAAGYYLVKDTGTIEGHDSYTRYILKVVNDVTVQHKGTVPTVEKKVEEKNDTTGATSTGDTADHDIGDDVKFTLTGTLPENYADYESYKYVFHDTLSTGLTYNEGSIAVVAGTTTLTKDTDYIVSYENNKLTITIADLKKVSGLTSSSQIVVTYTAKLNENATIGGEGNKNAVKLEFSNDPNFDGDGTPPTGNTPEDTVVVFTYKTIINKVDEKNEALTGAAFKLEKLIKGVDGAEDNWTTVKEFTITDPAASTFSFDGLDAGKYKLTETVTPAGYNTIDPIEFEITATNDGTKITGLTGTATDLTFTPDTSAGSLSADVVNKAGTVLPSTGGMGTTLFYVFGGLLVAAAVILLVTKRRMGTAE